MDNPRHDSIFRCDREIFVVSALILYLELVLIRWIGTEIRIFAYLGNLILVVCFLGVGLGCSLSERPLSSWRIGLNVFLLTFLVANPLHWEQLNFTLASYLLSGFEDAPIWQEMTGVGRLSLTVRNGIIIGGILLGSWLTFISSFPWDRFSDGPCNAPRA